MIPNRRQLHAVVARWFDDEEHKSPRKPWSIGRIVQTSTGFDVTIGLMRADIEGPLLRRAVGVGQLGRIPYEISSSPVLANRFSWQELLDNASQVDSWVFDCTTPVVFRSGSKTVAPTAGLVFGHFRAVWCAFCPPELRDTFEGLTLDGMLTGTFDGHHAPVGEAAGWGRVNGRGFVGMTTISAEADAPTLRLLDTLAALAPFSGIGSATPFGCGVASQP